MEPFEMIIYAFGAGAIPVGIIFFKQFGKICERLTRVETKVDIFHERVKRMKK